MKNFILKNSFIDSIHNNKEKLKKNYMEIKTKLFFNNLVYEDYYLSILFPKKRNDNWDELKNENDLFKDIFMENKDIIVPSINISRINPNKNNFIAHRHTHEMDAYIYHYVLSCNDKCGMIIKNEYLPYKEDLIFGFKADKKHIAFNFGETPKDSLEFIVLNQKYTLKEWFDMKIKNIIENNYNLIEMNKKYAYKQIKKFILLI